MASPVCFGIKEAKKRGRYQLNDYLNEAVALTYERKDVIRVKFFLDNGADPSHIFDKVPRGTPEYAREEVVVIPFIEEKERFNRWQQLFNDDETILDNMAYDVIRKFAIHIGVPTERHLHNKKDFVELLKTYRKKHQ